METGYLIKLSTGGQFVVIAFSKEGAQKRAQIIIERDHKLGIITSVDAIHIYT